jgi:hypothetical protein
MTKRLPQPYSSVMNMSSCNSEATPSKSMPRLSRTEDQPCFSRAYVWIKLVQNAPVAHAHFCQVDRWQINATHGHCGAYSQIHQSTGTQQTKGTSGKNRFFQNQMGPNCSCFVELRTQAVYAQSSTSGLNHRSCQQSKSAALSLTLGCLYSVQGRCRVICKRTNGQRKRGDGARLWRGDGRHHHPQTAVRAKLKIFVPGADSFERGMRMG